MEVVVDQDKQQHGKGRTGTLENPETYENVPGHVIPIIEREFDDFDNEAEKFLAGELAEDQFIGFRLKQGVYGQRQPDVQMVRVKLPFGGVTPEQMEAFASVVEKWAPLNKGHITTRQNIQIHHVPLRDMESLLREISEVGLSSREGCGNTVRNVTGDPWAGVAADEVFDPTPYAGAYVRYFVRHPTTQLMPRKIKTSFTGSDEDRAISGIHDIAFLSRERDGVKGFEVRVGGGTSIMARVAPTLYEFVEADNGDYLKVAEAALRIFDRQEWLRVNRARARIKVLIDKIGIDAFREQVDEELQGDWVAEREFDPGSSGCASTTTRRRTRPSARRRPRLAQRRPHRVRALRRGQRPGPAPGGLLDGRGEDRPRRPDPGAVPRPRPRSCASSPAATRAAPCSRTSSCAGSATRRSTTSGSGSTSLGLGEAGAARDHRRGQLPRHRQLQTRDHQLDGPQPGDQGAGRGDGDHRRADQADPHQDERLPERLQPAPHRQHRLLRRLAESRRPPDARLHPAHRRQLRGRRGGLRHAAQIAAAGQTRARGGRALDQALRGRARNEGEEFNAFAERAGAERFEEEIKELTLPAEFSLETMQQFIDWNRSSPYKVERGEGECAI